MIAVVKDGWACEVLACFISSENIAYTFLQITTDLDVVERLCAYYCIVVKTSGKKMTNVEQPLGPAQWSQNVNLWVWIHILVWNFWRKFSPVRRLKNTWPRTEDTGEQINDENKEILKEDKWTEDDQHWMGCCGAACQEESIVCWRDKEDEWWWRDKWQSFSIEVTLYNFNQTKNN